MNKQLGNATAFFTFSVADMQWPDLAHFLDTDNRTIAQAIAHSPLTVDSYLGVRFDTFFKHFLTPYFLIDDYWYRFEWQHRGSLHVHGLAWLQNAPNTQTCTQLELTSYWDKYVCTWNPAIEHNQNPANFYWDVRNHPCSLRGQDVDNLENYLKDLVNICQKHTRCNPGYCLRTQPDGTQKCRFGFLKELQAQTSVDSVLDEQGRRTSMAIKSATNDPLLNNYNCRCMVTWTANHDVSLTFDITDAAKYIAKYTSKAETASTDYTQVYHQIITQQLPPEANIQRTATALLLNTIARDVCAQEAVHVVASLLLYHSSRSFVTLKVDGQTIQANLPGQGNSDMRKYMARPPAFHAMSFFAFTKSFRLIQHRNANFLTAHARIGGDAIMQIFPKYSSDPVSDKFAKYCMQFLALHKPFTQWNQLLAGFENPVDAYTQFSHENPLLVDQEQPLENAVEQAAAQLAQDAEIILENPPHERKPWMGLLDQEDDLPFAQPALQANPDFDWVDDSQHLLHLDPHAPTSLIDAQNNYNPPPIEIPLVDISQLNNEQRQVYDRIENHSQLPNPLPLRALVLGSAGTGKRFLIQALHQLLGQCRKILAPTGVAALNISGSTIHSFLHFAKPTDTRS
ncbi:uncharacterized protein [Watersipora subatra]|uniref:uncharacterized protein n=1 Tax=Watersipora subatra TaxID=2589382 RepID=UPI00355B0834